MLDNQCFEFFNNDLLTIVLASLGELDDPRYAFLVAYQDAKAFER